MTEGRPLTRFEWVDRRLRDAILSGEIRPGERLNTAALAEQFSVSPTPLREAIQRLGADGLVEFTPQRGARVAAMSLAEYRELHEMRVLLEPLALERSLKHFDSSSPARVEASLKELGRAMRSPDEGAAARELAHRGLHLALVADCGSEWLIRLISTLIDHSARYNISSIAGKRVLDEHKKLVKVCLGKSPAKAVSALRSHLDWTLQIVEDAAKKGDFPLDRDAAAKR